MPATPRAQPPQVGETYMFNPANGQGHGHNAKGQPLSAEMTELDLMPGTLVVVYDIDVDSDWPIVEWTDGKNLPRMTTISLDDFNASFEIQ